MSYHPEIICLCGSTKFKTEFIQKAVELTYEGKIVVTVHLFTHADKFPLLPETKKFLDRLHLRKIDLADRVFVINPGGYIGESTANEITYATRRGIPIDYMEPTDEN